MVAAVAGLLALVLAAIPIYVYYRKSKRASRQLESAILSRNQILLAFLPRTAPSPPTLSENSENSQQSEDDANEQGEEEDDASGEQHKEEDIVELGDR